MTTSSKVKRGTVLFCLCIGIYFVFLAMKQERSDPGPVQFNPTSGNNIRGKSGEEREVIAKHSSNKYSKSYATTSGTDKEGESAPEVKSDEGIVGRLSLQSNTESPSVTGDGAQTASPDNTDEIKRNIEDQDSEEPHRSKRAYQDQLLVSIEGKYSGDIEITDQLYTNETGVSKLKCTIEIDTSDISSNDVSSIISIYKPGEPDPYFKLSFSGESIYEELQLLEDLRFSIGSADLGHRFELVLSDKDKSMSGKFLVIDSRREWKPVGRLKLEKSV